MATRQQIKMSWSKCKIEVGKTGDDDAFATELFSLGTIKDKSTTMSSEDGDKLEAKATGGILVAEEYSEPTVSITTRIIEPEFETISKLTGNVVDTENGTLTVATNLIVGDWSLKVTPKNIGSVGVKARRTSVTYKPGYSEEEGHYADITFKILETVDGELYTKYKVKDSDWA